MPRLISHFWSDKRVHIIEHFGDSSWTGILIGGIREFGMIKYVIQPDNEQYVILVDPGHVYIWLAKDQPDEKPLPKNVVKLKKLRTKK